MGLSYWGRRRERPRAGSESCGEKMEVKREPNLLCEEPFLSVDDGAEVDVEGLEGISEGEGFAFPFCLEVMLPV